METLIEHLIVDFWDRPLPELTARDLRLPWLQGKVDCVIGMRRSGKTWFLYQVMQQLVAQGWDRSAFLYLNLEDERLWPLTLEGLSRVPEVFFRLKPQLRGQPTAFFLDEIQNVSGWERFVRRLVDSESAHLCLSGSSSKLLSTEIATSLRGRALATEVFPFSFVESLAHIGMELPPSDPPPARIRSQLEHRFRTYLLEGGFPEVQEMEGPYRVRVLQNYLDVVILRDLVERHGIANTVALRYLVRHLMDNPACHLSIHRLYNDLRSQGVKVSKDSLHQYLEHLHDAYLAFPVEIFSDSLRVRRSNPRKLYPVDTGLVRACASRVQADLGRLLETTVFLHMRRQGLDVTYYRTSSGKEVDFFASRSERRPFLLQVCLDLRSPDTRARELSALVEAMEETGLEEGTVVTLDQDEVLSMSAGTIHIVPAWRWMLRATQL
ncbi:MAG: ATP-binding protein [Bradymonadales bacterium]|nr:ATP-binding protein [Bradymonadales bacterium]